MNMRRREEGGRGWREMVITSLSVRHSTKKGIIHNVYWNTLTTEKLMLMDGWMDGRMECDYRCFSTECQSYNF